MDWLVEATVPALKGGLGSVSLNGRSHWWVSLTCRALELEAFLLERSLRNHHLQPSHFTGREWRSEKQRDVATLHSK